jgi:hypothetical protein
VTAPSEWVTATPERPCPVCGHDSWCRVSPDGAAGACRRDPSGTPRTYADGGEYWLHYLGDPDPTLRGAGEGMERPQLSEDDVVLRDRVYRALLARLPLSDRHRENLVGRGLGDDAITAGGYTSLPNTDLDFRMMALRDEFTAPELDRVPGVSPVEKGNSRQVRLAQSNGILVPVRNVEDRVVALKVRRDFDDPRYVYLSDGRPSAGSHVHVPMFAARPAMEVRVTEGELKADVATVLSGVATISVPGVQMWRIALDVLPSLGARRVIVAFDADKATNDHVARAEQSLIRGLWEAGYAVEVEEWATS